MYWYKIGQQKSRIDPMILQIVKATKQRFPAMYAKAKFSKFSPEGNTLQTRTLHIQTHFEVYQLQGFKKCQRLQKQFTNEIVCLGANRGDMGIVHLG